MATGTQTLYPTSDNGIESYSGSYNNVKEVTQDGDTTYNIFSPAKVTTGTDLFNMGDMDTTGLTNVVITNVRINCIARGTSDGPKLKCLIKISTTNYGDTTNQVLTTSYADYYYDFTNNPATSTAWTVSDINGLVAGYYGEGILVANRITQVKLIISYTYDAPPSGPFNLTTLLTLTNNFVFNDLNLGYGN